MRSRVFICAPGRLPFEGVVTFSRKRYNGAISEARTFAEPLIIRRFRNGWFTLNQSAVAPLMCRLPRLAIVLVCRDKFWARDHWPPNVLTKYHHGADDLMTKLVTTSLLLTEEQAALLKRVAGSRMMRGTAPTASVSDVIRTLIQQHEAAFKNEIEGVSA